MSLTKSFSARRAAALLALMVLACAASGSSGDGAASSDDPAGVDCSTLPTCEDGVHCSGGAQCFKLKSCPGFVCAEAKVACRGECSGGDCLVLESQPMMLSCR